MGERNKRRKRRKTIKFCRKSTRPPPQGQGTGRREKKKGSSPPARPHAKYSSSVSTYARSGRAQIIRTPRRGDFPWGKKTMMPTKAIPYHRFSNNNSHVRSILRQRRPPGAYLKSLSPSKDFLQRATSMAGSECLHIYAILTLELRHKFSSHARCPKRSRGFITTIKPGWCLHVLASWTFFSSFPLFFPPHFKKLTL